MVFSCHVLRLLLIHIYLLQMAKLNISDDYLTIALLEKFFVFSLYTGQDVRNNVKVINCSENIQKSKDASIECCAFSPCGQYFGVCFDKNIIIYNTFDWNVLYSSPGERKACSLQFFPKSKIVLLADKSGSATFYSFEQDKLEKTEHNLGHNSMLTSALVTDDEKHVITSDRDEKIRVTNYPNVYNIESYCLGHKMFVSFVGFLPSDRRILVSTSGDGTVRFWNFLSGKEIAIFDCNDSNDCNENFKRTLTKIVMYKHEDMSIIALVEYKSNEIRILFVRGDLNKGLNVEITKVLKLDSIPWDIVFWKKSLVCLLPNKQNPLQLFSVIESPVIDNNFKIVSQYLISHWDTFISMSSKISDDIPVLFKREVDNIQEYEKKKKARLLKTGKPY